jgi:hypothetical protein
MSESEATRIFDSRHTTRRNRASPISRAHEFEHFYMTKYISFTAWTGPDNPYYIAQDVKEYFESFGILPSTKSEVAQSL